MILLTLQNVFKSFVMNDVLKDINLTLQVGQRMGLVGVNGSGKSTLFRIISGEMEPDSGNVSLMKGTRVGVLTQHADIKSDLTIQEELERISLAVETLQLWSERMLANGHIDAQQYRKLKAQREG